MKVAYCSLLLPEDKNLEEKCKGRLSGVSLHKFSSAIIEGIDKNLEKPVRIFNIINVLNYPNYPDIFFRTEKWKHTEGAEDLHIGYVNLFGIKYLTQEHRLYCELKKWKKENPNEKLIICVHHIYYPMMKAAYRIKKKYGNDIKICLITGDMTGKYGLMSQNTVNLKQKLTCRLEQKIEKLVPKFDCFVFATKYMAEAYGVQDKPMVVVECAYTPPGYVKKYFDYGENVNKEDKIIFYAGAIRKEYGIEHLLRAFSLIKAHNYKLWLAGGGNAQYIVEEYAKKDERIKYLGFISPKEVEARQMDSTVLISPRQSNHLFVKYSFPSKTMEGLASGKPYIAHKLPCDPPEYADYINYAKDETDEALKEKIIEICEMDYDERNKIGERAIEFIYKQKNPVVMTKKIVEMWNLL